MLSITELFTQAEAIKNTAGTQGVIDLYRSWLDNNRSEHRHFALFNLAVAYSELGDKAAAEGALLQAVALKNDFLQAHMNLGSIYESRGEPELAVKQWQVALALPSAKQPAQREMARSILNQLGRLLEILYRYDQAEDCLTRSLAISSDQPDVIQHLVHLRQRQCKWPVLPELPGVRANKFLNAISPLGALALFDDPTIQLLVSQNFVSRKLNSNTPAARRKEKYNHKRLRVGFLSGDLCTHAVGLLLGNLFESLSRERVETYAFDYSPNDRSAQRGRLLSAIEHVYVVGEHSDEVVAQHIADQEIDVLVDLHGLSKGLRDGVLSRRPAPVQVTYLGFIGTTAMPWIDYVIVDRYAFTEDMRPFFSEQPLMLESSFLPRDDLRDRPPLSTREAQGLPAKGFVFASFNNSYKITQEVFNAWLEILRRVPRSVLWLVDDNKTATDNLKAAAAREGLSDRLIMSPRVAPREYLARLGVVDLFLDCYPYNAGSTARDVLFMGTPLLTMSGRTLVSRMAGSILTEAGLPELIVNDLAAYVDRAVSLACNPAQLDGLRDQISRYLEAGDRGKKMGQEFEALLFKAHSGGVSEPVNASSRIFAKPKKNNALDVLARRGSAAVSNVSQESVRLYQIAYSEQTQATVRPPFMVLDNMANLRPDWQEYWPIRRFLLNERLDESCYYGFFSPRFTEKTGLDAQGVLDYMSQHTSSTDVFTFSPQPDMGAFFLNVFEQNELFDPGFTAASQAFVDHLGLNLSLGGILMDSRHIVFSNYFVARPKFWRDWLVLTESLFDICEKGSPKEIATAFCDQTTYRGGIERKVFLLERLVCLLLATREDLRVQNYNTFNCAWSATKVSQSRDEAVISDALKIAMKEQGFSHYVSVFSSLRSRLKG